MSYSITASNKYGPISLVRKTANEAFELALSYKRKGFGEIRVSDIQTGEVYGEPQIVEGRLPADGREGSPLSQPSTVTVLRLPG